MLRKWWLKAAVQGTLSVLPYHHRLNRFFQNNITHSIQPDLKTLHSRIRFVPKHIEHYRQYQTGDGLPPVILELGTGWFPIVPLGLFLCGARQIITLDLNPLLTLESLRGILRTFAKMPEANLRELLPNMLPERYKDLCELAEKPEKSMDELLTACNIRYVIADARALDLPADSIDYIISNLTFEHIAPDILDAILHEFRRVIAPNGLMSHLIDMSDHYSHFDRSINRYHFLRFSDPVWRWFNNSLHYQSRLRISDYRELHTKNGFTVIAEDNQYLDRAALDKIPLASQFEKYKTEDLLPTLAWQVSRPDNAQH